MRVLGIVQRERWNTVDGIGRDGQKVQPTGTVIPSTTYLMRCVSAGTGGAEHMKKRDSLVEGCGSWALELDPRPVGQSKALPPGPSP